MDAVQNSINLRGINPAEMSASSGPGSAWSRFNPTDTCSCQSISSDSCLDLLKCLNFLVVFHYDQGLFLLLYLSVQVVLQYSQGLILLKCLSW